MRRICLFAGYDKGDKIQDYVVYLIKELAKISDVYYMANGNMPPDELFKIAPYTKMFYSKRHDLRDFGSWRYLIEQLGWDKIAEYDELVDELYLYLTENDAEKLKSFQFRSSVYQWLKVLSIRFFIRLRNQGKVIENDSHEPPYQGESDHAMETTVDYDNAKEDLKRLLAAMRNRRYAYVIERLIIDDVEPKQLAEEMHITTANLYNIKNHAIHQLTEVALNDIYHYGNQ